ncbi:MAG TPA: helix-turn-helix domain-containing protein [Candidatus Angelobacter sp.]|jgi:DNA-binding NtrC family response regulator|nr:helix-turn-helix domain-containing protein [Candidatus Angelobacter sp.]
MAKKKLLIIDIQPTIRWALRNYFEDRGYEVAEAESGIEALAQAERFHPDALVLDCHVLNEDVNQLVEQLKAVLPALPVILLVTYETIDRAIQMTKIGFGDQSQADLPLLEVEKRHIQTVLRNNRGNVERAAAVLGISRSSLYERIKRYGIKYP